MFQVRSHTTEAQQWCKAMVDGESTVIVFTRYFECTQNLPSNLFVVLKLTPPPCASHSIVNKMAGGVSYLKYTVGAKSTDIHVEWERWKYLFLVLFAEYIPMETLRGTPPWIDSQMTSSFKKRFLSEKGEKISCLRLWQKFREFRRSAKSLLVRRRIHFFQKLSLLPKSNS